MKKKIKIYIDFDGTISKADVLNYLLDAFTDGKWLPIDERYLDGEISSKECISEQVALMSDVSTNLMLKKAEEVGIDPTFKSFVDKCIKSSIIIEILSDGLDLYIKHLLAQSGVEGIDIKANHYAGSGKVEFPYYHQLCEKSCGNCKKFHIEADSFAVYIGDGSSDFCAAAQCDLIFAKESLAKHLKGQNLSFLPYNNFDDVHKLLKEKRLLC